MGAALDVGAWLQALGLPQYERTFRENAVDEEVLPELGETDLEKLGVLLGHRKRILKALAELRSATAQRPRARAEAERRQLTVMFVDLVGSTALAERLDPEEVREVIRDYQNIVSGEVARLEGQIAQFIGDGVLAYFGWPQAHEDEAERAVRAGLAITTAVGTVSVPGGHPLACRVGIATGLIVVGDLVGRPEAPVRTVVGGTPNMAARLQQAAPANAVVVDETVRRLIGGAFELESMGPLTLKGIEAPVAAYRVHRQSAVAGRFDAHQAGQPLPMVGRDQELALLLDRWRQAQAGEGQCVVLIGEAGIGKSRVARALRDALAGEPHTAIRYQCSPYHADSPLWPTIEQLGHAAGFLPEDTTAARRAKLEALLRKDGHEPGEALILLAALLGLEEAGPALPDDLTPEQRRLRTLAVLIGQLLVLARRNPVLLEVEDAHWIDPTTLELLEQTPEAIADARVLMLVTARLSFEPGLGSHPHLTRLALNRLGREAGMAIIARLAEGRSVPEEVAAELIARTDGVPLFLEELTRTVLRSSALRRTDAAYLLEEPLPSLAIPATLHDSLMARLDQLSSGKEVAQTAACIGREFTLELVAAVSPLSQPELQVALDQLLDAGIVFRRGSRLRPSYIFKHALLRDAAYQSLLRSRRAQLHARIAEVLLAQPDDAAAEHPELLAWHYTEAGLTEPAIEEWRRAGERSLARFANREAVAHLGRALELLATLPPGAQRDQAEADLRLALVVPLTAVHGFGSGEVEACAQRAVELGAVLPDWPGRFAAERILWNSRLMRHPVPVTLGLARELLVLADRSADRAQRAVACRALGYTLSIAGEQPEADRLLAEGTDLADELPDAALAVYGEQPQIICRVYRGLVLCLMGHPETGISVSEEGLSRARERSNSHHMAWAHVGAGNTHLFARNAAEAARHGAEAMAIAREHRLPQWLAFGAESRGWGLCHLGAVEEGLALLEESLYRLHGTGARLHTTRIHGLLAECCLLAGRLEAASEHLRAARQHAAGFGERYMAAELHRLSAALLQAQGAPRRAVEAELRKARRTAAAQGARLLELRAAVALARLQDEQGAGGAMRRLLAQCCRQCSEGRELPDLQEATALLEKLARCSGAAQHHSSS